MIVSNPVYDCNRHGQFQIWFQTNELYSVFKKNNISDEFLLCEYITSSGDTIYNLYLNDIRFSCGLTSFTSEETGFAKGFRVFSYRFIEQSDTMRMAVKSVRIINHDSDLLYVMGSSDISNRYDYNDTFVDVFKKINNMLDKATSQVGSKPVEKNEKYIEYIANHHELNRCKETFANMERFSLRYSAFEAASEYRVSGVVYKFKVDFVDEDDVGKLKEGTGVSISTNVLDPKSKSFDSATEISGTVANYDAPWVYIQINSNASYTDIPASGYLNERQNPEYRYKTAALSSLQTGSSPNKYLLDILVGRKVAKYNYKQIYFPHTVTEKDGSTHDNVNPRQCEAINKALQTTDFLLVQGPPGTGKTTIITEMIKEFVKQDKRVLICSKNNLAVDNVLEKCDDLYYDKDNTQKMLCLRLGTEAKVLPAIHHLLQRPLTSKIQDDIKKRSQETQKAKNEEKEHLAKSYQSSVVSTAIPCAIMSVFLGKREYFRHIDNTLTRKPVSFLFGKKSKDFHQSVKSLLEISNIICTDMYSLIVTANAVVSAQASKQNLVNIEKFFELCQQLVNSLPSSGLLFRLITRTDKNKFLNEINTALKFKNNILKDAETLFNYKGNSAAPHMQIRLHRPEDVPAEYADYIRTSFDELKDNIEVNYAMFTRVLELWHEELTDDKASLSEPLLQSVKIIGATCIGVNTNNHFKNLIYDIAIVDEAGQITLHDLLVPLAKAKKIILIGDHLQLPPGGESDFCDYIEANNLLDFTECETPEEYKDYKNKLNDIFSISLFEDLFNDPVFNKNKVMLDTQFRMHPDIATFISDNFYNGQYKSGVSAKSRTLNIADFDKPLYFFDTANCPQKYEDIHDDNKIHTNSFEAEICGKKIADIIVAIENGGYPKLIDKNGAFDIGVITAYKAQIPVIRKAIIKHLCNDYHYSKERAEGLTKPEVLAINTLDSFQGRDNQIIFYSFVRSNKTNSIGFLNEVRRLNVMMTRAKSLLVMVGDSETLINSEAFTIHDRKPKVKASVYFNNLVKYCKTKNGYIDVAKAGEF